MRAYRWGAKGLNVKSAIKKFKTHRSRLEIEFQFISERTTSHKYSCFTVGDFPLVTAAIVTMP